VACGRIGMPFRKGGQGGEERRGEWEKVMERTRMETGRQGTEDRRRGQEEQCETGKSQEEQEGPVNMSEKGGEAIQGCPVLQGTEKCNRVSSSSQESPLPSRD